MAPKPFSILFITSSRIGDAVLSSGLVKTLVDEIPDARFTIVGSALTTPLFADTPGLERLVVMDKQKRAGHWFGLWRQVRGRRWGLVVDLRGSAIAGALRPKRRAVHRKGATSAHKVIEAARLLKLETQPPSPFLFTSPETEARAAQITAGEGPILAMAPAANWVGKTWPVERFAQVARRLLAPSGPLAGGRLMVVGGPDDAAGCDPLRASVGKDRCIDLVGREPLTVVYAALKRARLFIGNDSGLMHMAAAAGAPTLGLFGPSDEELYAPWGPKARALRGTRTFEEIQALDPTLSQAITHMMDLSADSVYGAAVALLDDTEEAAEAAETEEA
ncbi:MAG: glycosyltransferase family 9 protein [Proteobacteria bacterium]|nr:glycosyltransferase family 9 protein [Pseudomonadota bacterium]